MLLMGIYLLAYNGVPVTDDEHMYLGAAQSLAARGEVAIPQLYGNGRLLGRYPGAGPAHIFLATPLATLVQDTQYGFVQTLYLLTPLYTALTAAVIFLLARQLGFGRKTAIVAALLYGLGTMAFPYAQTFFREPLAALLLMLSWLFFELAFDDRKPSRLRWLLALAFVITLTAAALTKFFVLVTLPAFLILTLARRGRLLRSKKGWFGLGAALFLGLLLLWALTALLPGVVTTRFSPALIGRILRIIRQPQYYRPLAGALTGIFLSPSKGLLLYSPPVWLALIALVHWGRQHWQLLLLPFSGLVGFALAQGIAFGASWWNITWGTRFILPVIPLLLVAGLPAIQAALEAHSRALKLTLGVLGVAGFLIQLGGVLIADPTYLQYMYTLKPDLSLTIWDWTLAPLHVHWQLYVQGASRSLALWRLRFLDLGGVQIILFLSLTGITVSAVLLRRSLQNQKAVARQLWGAALALGLLNFLILPLLILGTYRPDPRFASGRSDLAEALEIIHQNEQAGDAAAVHAYLRPAWYYTFNHGHLEMPWYSLPLPGQAHPYTLLDLLAQLGEGYERVWLLTEVEQSVSSQVIDEDELGETVTLLETWKWQTDPNWTVRLGLYELD